MKEMPRENNVIFRILGFFLLILGIFFTTVSVFEQITILSPDHTITSEDFIFFIHVLRIFLIITGLLFFVYPQILQRGICLFFVLQKQYTQKKMNLPPFSFVVFLLLILFLFISFTFIGQFHTLSTTRQLHNTESESILSDTVITTQYFYRMFLATLSTTEIDTTQIDIPIYKFYIKEHLLDSLNKDLPLSGEEYVNGYLVLEESAQENNTYEAKFHYRGDTFYHWYFKKKSWRVKLRNETLIDSSNKFNIINPKLDSHLEILLVGHIAEQAGLITPRTYPVALFVNNRYEGLYTYVDQIDELFMRNQGRVPGDIIYGELYGDATRTGTLFENVSNWDIMATSDNNENRTLRNMGVFLHAVNGSDLEFYTFFNQHLGEQYLKFYALTLLIDENRVDDYHNHKFYFDPTSGVFEPIVWDLMPFLDNELSLNSNETNLLFTRINRIPEYVEKRNLFLYQLMNELSEEELSTYIDDTASSFSYELEHDMYKDSYNPPWVLSYEQWKKSLDDLKQDIHNRYLFLQQELENTSVTVTFVNNTFIIFDVSGESGVKVDTLLLPGQEAGRSCHSLFKDRNFNFVADEGEGIYSGCDKNMNAIAAFMNETLYPGRRAPLRYVYILQTNSSDLIENSILQLSNSITGNSISPHIKIISSLEILEELPPSESLHPWLLPVDKNSTITLEGEVTLTEDLLLNKRDTLIIKPGTTIQLASGVSIISYGKIIANGTAMMPISFVPLTNDAPWGALVLQGEGADGSILRHCILDGGSGTQQDMVVYTGMVSAYNAEILIDSCTFMNNTIADDAFNSKYTQVHITNSTFMSIFSDAIDLDISSGLVAHNTFIDVNGDAIDLMTSTSLIKDNYIVNAQDKGISIGEMSTPIVINNTILSSNIGIAIKDMSDPLIINNTLINNSIGLGLYQKNWKYGGGGLGELQDTDLCSNVEPLVVQNSSVIRIIQNTTSIECTEKNCTFTCSQDSSP